MTGVYQTLLVETDGRGVFNITLNRPDVRNAFNDTLIGELHAAIDNAGGDDHVRAIVLRGAGSAFSAGADLDWMKRAADYTKDENRADAMRLSDMLDALNRAPKPVLALVDGPAFGGGVGLVACADIAIATPKALFALSEVRLGLIPATISPYVIAAIGERESRRYMMTGARFDAKEAHRIGLVQEVAESAETADALKDEWLGHILASGPDAVAATKDLISSVTGRAIDSDLRAQTAKRIAERRASGEGREGIRAFLEKRKPAWIKDDG